MATFQLFFQSGRAKDLTAPLYFVSPGQHFPFVSRMLLYIALFLMYLFPPERAENK